MQDLVHQALPGHRIVSSSDPEPQLRTYNIVAIYRSADQARNAVLALESIEADDAAIGLTVVEPPDTPDVSAPGADPEGIMHDIVPRTLKGAVIGAVVGAVVIGLATALLASDIWIGGALGGALMGATFGALWGAFLRMGGSSAYRQTFVATSSGAVTMVSLHCQDRTEATEARSRLALEADSEPVVLQLEDGELTPVA